MVKRAPLEVIRAGTVHPGKYLVLVGGLDRRRRGGDARPGATVAGALAGRRRVPARRAPGRGRVDRRGEAGGRGRGARRDRDADRGGDHRRGRRGREGRPGDDPRPAPGRRPRRQGVRAVRRRGGRGRGRGRLRRRPHGRVRAGRGPRGDRAASRRDAGEPRGRSAVRRASQGRGEAGGDRARHARALVAPRGRPLPGSGGADRSTAVHGREAASRSAPSARKKA